MNDQVLDLLFYCVPAAITGAVAYFSFKNFTDAEDRKRTFLLHRANRKQALPLRLQAYERMTLFLERIDPAKLLIRVAPVSEKREDYVNFVIAQVDQEFEHNMTQQIYMSDECWGYIVTAKNAIIQTLRKYGTMTEIADADALREQVIRDSFDNTSPSTAALAYIRSEVRELI